MSKRGEPLRRRLFLLAAAAILPLAAGAGAALLALHYQQRAQTERAALEIARALSTAVDAELRRAMASLEAIANSPSLDAGDLRRFHETMRRVHAGRREWVTVTLADIQGRQIANARAAFGAPLGPVVETESFARLLRERRPVVGLMAQGPGGELGVPVRAPVERDGEVRYVLTAALKPSVIFEVLDRQRIPADWVVTVLDSALHRVARSRQQAAALGQSPSESLKRLMAERGAEGYGTTLAVEGDKLFSAYTRSPESGWTVAVGIPTAVVNQAAWRSLAVYGGAMLLSIILGILAALAIGRGIVGSMASLRAAAQSLGRRQPVTPPATPILEIREVGSALAAAAEERAGYEAEREEILRREQQARAAAESASRAKDEFLAMLGHELRNPLGAIANASRLLEQTSARPDGIGLARDVIRRQVDHLTRLTDDLLDAGRAVTGKILLERQTLELGPLVARALDGLLASGRLGGHRVERSLAAGVWVHADPTRLEQIVVNLIGNAAKFTPAGGTIALAVAHDGGSALLSVSDTGIGMSASLRERAFDLFVQGDDSLARTRGGLGIGLTLVRRIAELHGGRADAASPGPGAGSRFCVWLPAVPAPAGAPEATPAQVPPSRARDIVIVEDNADAARTLQQLLELAGHRVRVAADGAAGLDMLRAQPPDVALVDVGLPRMNGYELARAARAGAKAPFLVALTGYGSPEDRRRALEAGFDEHLVKPVDFEALSALLARLS